jgi:integrase
MTRMDRILPSDAAEPHSVVDIDSAGLFFSIPLGKRLPASPASLRPCVPPPLVGRGEESCRDNDQAEFAFVDANPLARARKARDRYEATLPRLQNYADFRSYWLMIRRLGLTGETSIYLREHLRLFLEPMGRLSLAEVVGVLSMSRAVALECVRLMRNEGGYARRAGLRTLYRESAFGREELRNALPSSLRNLPGTWLCFDYGDEFTALPSAIILRLTMIRSPRLRTAAILEVLLLSAEGTRAGLDVPTAAFERWDDAFAEAGLSADRSDHWLEVARRYSITRDLQVTHAIGPRISAYERWGAAEYRRANYARDERELAKALGKARLPALPSGKATKQFLREFRKVRDRYGIACTEHRKVDADNLSDNFAARLAAGQLRARQGVRLWREAEAGAAALRQSHTLDRQVFSWTEEVLSPLGNRRRQLQTIRLEAVYRDVLESELGAGCVQPQFRFIEDEFGPQVGAGTHRAQRPSSEPDGVNAIDATRQPHLDSETSAPRDIVFRFIEVVSNNGSASAPPWWVELFASGVLVGPCRLRLELRECRRAALIRLRVPVGDSGPKGLVGPDGPNAARLHQRALNAGIVLVSAEAFGHAMAIGAVAMRTLALTFARIGELLQMVRRTGRDAWQNVDVEGRGKRPAWMAFAKGARTRSAFIVYDNRTMPLITTLVRMRLVRERKREVAIVAPWRALARKVDADRYVFAFRDRMLSPDDLNYIYQVLMAGIQRIRNHDMRHSAANRSSREGVTEAEVAFRLKHAGAAPALPTRLSGRFALAGTYARDTVSQRDSDARAYCDARLDFERLLGVPLSGDLV